MGRLLWPLSVLVICLPVALLATGVPLPWVTRGPGLPGPLPVPAGDQELAYLHTTTAWATWERFVAGMVRAQALVPGLAVDASDAFVDQTTAVPEVVLSMPGRAGRVRVRWYKMSNEAPAGHWVKALADRSPPPLALVGGGSSDRAVDLATALQRCDRWRGDRPLLLITTATAVGVPVDADDPQAHQAPGADTKNLIDVYKGKTFRFCFSNRQMADAVVDFVLAHSALRPRTFAAEAAAAAVSGLALGVRELSPPGPADWPQAFSVVWGDDPYSVDLQRRFADALTGLVQLDTTRVAFSVGGFARPNPDEARVAGEILRQFNDLPAQRSLLVLPTVTQPARRLLRALAESAPGLGHRMVAVTGDGIPVNAVLRDGEFAWPVHALPVPLVLFTHHNPVAWDAPGGPPPPAGAEFAPPNGTEEALHFAELTRVVADACYPPAGAQPAVPTADGLVTRADDLAVRLAHRAPAFFDGEGNRLETTGEHVVVLWPRREDGVAGPRTLPRATLEVWKRGDGKRWDHVKTVDVDQRPARAPGGRPG